MLRGHGGNLRQIAQDYKISQDKIIDFSSNVNPAGLSYKRAIIAKANLINQYPDPECKSTKSAIAKYLRISPDNILVGNGSNELIYLIPAALNCASAIIYQPTFSEYELGLRLSQTKIHTLFAKEDENFRINVKKIIQYAPKVKLIILCNPNNPTGCLLKKNELFDLIDACAKNKTYLVVDEAFMDFVEDSKNCSVIKKAIGGKYLLVLRSLTKFFGLAGLRIGYLVAHEGMIKKISRFQPTWSVNRLAQEIVADKFFDLNFIRKTKARIKREREFLFKQLIKIKAIHPYSPCANFIFCKITDKKISSRDLLKQLIKQGILVRDCRNFKGLDNRFFRVAVRRRKENLYLINCLRRVLE